MSFLLSLLAIPELDDMIILFSDVHFLLFNFLYDLFGLILLVLLIHIHLADHPSQVQ